MNTAHFLYQDQEEVSTAGYFLMRLNASPKILIIVANTPNISENNLSSDV